MTNQPWLEDVLARLAKDGLPPSYVRRLTEELSDHLSDLTEENMGTEAEVRSRLGHPEQVAEAAVAAYRQRGFVGRHPTAAVLVFGLSPIIAIVVLAAIGVATLYIFDEVWKAMGFDVAHALRNLKRFEPAATIGMTYVGSLLIIVIPSIIACLLYGRLARCLEVAPRWAMLSCIVLAAIALSAVCTAQLSDVPGNSRLTVGLSNPLGGEHILANIVSYLCTPRHLLQFLVPLAIGWWSLRRAQHLVAPVGNANAG